MPDCPAPALNRPNNFDAIRLALAIAVIFAHAYRISTNDTLDPLSRFSKGQTDLGAIAVFGFFAISGYLITASCERSRSAIDYLSRRVRRIYPGFAVALAISAFVIAPLFVRDGSHVDPLRVLVKFAIWVAVLNPWTSTHAFATHPMAGVVNGSLWTVQYEFACYLLLLLIASLGALRSRRVLLWIAAIVYAVHVARCANLIRFHTFNTLVFHVGPATVVSWVAAFLAGSVAYAFRVSPRFFLALLGAAALLVACRFPNLHAIEMCAPIALTYVLLTLAFAPLPFIANFARRVGGDYSYGTYLYAFPIQQMLVAHAGGTMRPLVNFAIATPLALLCGIASWHLIEKRFIRRDRREAVATIVPDAS